MTDIMVMAVGISAFIGFVLGVLLCAKAIDPMKEWSDGYSAARKFFERQIVELNFDKARNEAINLAKEKGVKG